MSTFKKVVSLIIAACLLLSVFPMSAFAASTTASSASALVSAFASAADGDTIVLGADITLAQTISVTKKVTLSAGGHTITRDGSFAGNLFAVTGELTLQDITLNGNRTSTAVANLASELIRVNGGKLNLKSGAVLTTNRANAASTAGGVWLEGGELNMYAGATIKGMHQHNNSGSNDIFGIAVNVNSGTFNMYGGTISNNDGKAGAVGIVGGTFNMYDGEIKDNIANASGNGGGAVHNAGTFNMYGGTISGNLSWNRGGGVTNTGTFNLENGTITNNSVAKDGETNCNGAGIYTTGIFNMTGGTVSRNTAQNSAGGIMIEGGTAVMSGGSVVNNSASANSGGGIFVGTGKFTMTGGIVSGNTAGQFGGGFAVTSSVADAFTISGGEVYGNNCSATHCGSDIYITTSAGKAMTSFGNGCIRYQLYLDNSGSRYSATNAVAVTKSALTAGYGYIYVSNGAAHSFSDWEITTESGCETTGIKERTCSACGEKETETVPAKGHNTISEKVDATCGTEGYIKLYCPVCGYVHNTSVIPATGHIASANWTVKTPATQTSAGVKVKYCKTCDVEVETASYTINDPIIYIEASEATAKDDATNTVELTINIKNNPGIWSTGFFVYYSSDLRITSVENGGLFGGDYYVDPVYNVEVSSDADAVELFKANGAPTEDVLYYCYYGEASGLENVTSDGAYAVLTFEYDSELEGKYEIGFVYDAENIINVDGENCDILFENYELEITPISACDHVAGAPVTTPAECETNGSIIVSCTKCGRQISKEILPATGHTAGTTWETVKAPEANAAGEKAIKCTVCGKALETKVIPALGETAIVISDAIVTAGENAEITASIQGNPGIWGVRMFIYYSDEISLSSVENGDIFADEELFDSTLNVVPAENFMAKPVFEAAGVDMDGLFAYCLYLEGEDIVEFTKNGTLATLNFAVPADASGEYAIGVILTDLINMEADNIAAEVYGGSVRVAEATCDHVAGGWSVVNAGSCTENKVEEQRCTLCGALLDTKITPASGHSYTAKVTAPTCTEAGFTTYTCSACGDSYVADEVPAAGHKYETTTNDATCTENGSVVTKCTVCGDTTTETIPAPGHKEVIDAAVEATCTETGLTEGKHCSVCGEILVAQTVVPVKAHSYKTEVVAPSCTEGGFTSYVCSVCGDSYIGDEVDALGHDYDAEVVEPTCTEGGFTSYVCSVCGDNYIGDETPAKGHDYDAEVVEPTCTEGGFTSYVCSVCGDSYIGDETPAKGHDYDAEVVEPTCTEGGFTSYVCSVCGDSYIGDEVDALGHTEVILPEIEATCTEAGYTEGKMCSVCGEVLVAQTEVPATGHNFVDGTCTNCGEIEEVKGFTITIDGVLFGTFEAGETVELPVPEMQLDSFDAFRFYTYTGAEVIRSEYEEYDTANGRMYTLVMPEGDVELTSDYVLIGDVNLDGEVSAKDNVALKKLIKGISEPSSEKQAEAADVRLDGEYTSRDSVAMKKIIAGTDTPSK